MADAPTGLQLDLLTVVARLRQLREEPWFDSNHYLLERIMTCDLPRLESHLTPEAVAWMERGEESWRAKPPPV